MFLLITLPLILIASTNAENCPTGDNKDTETMPKNPKIEWVPCNYDSGPELECGSAKVPLDYTGVTPGVLTLPLVRWPTKQPSSKSIVVNPGGPGNSGIEFLAEAGSLAYETLLKYASRYVYFT